MQEVKESVCKHSNLVSSIRAPDFVSNLNWLESLSCTMCTVQGAQDSSMPKFWSASRQLPFFKKTEKRNIAKWAIFSPGSGRSLKSHISWTLEWGNSFYTSGELAASPLSHRLCIQHSFAAPTALFILLPAFPCLCLFIRMEYSNWMTEQPINSDIEG